MKPIAIFGTALGAKHLKNSWFLLKIHYGFHGSGYESPDDREGSDMFCPENLATAISYSTSSTPAQMQLLHCHQQAKLDLGVEECKFACGLRP